MHQSFYTQMKKAAYYSSTWKLWKELTLEKNLNKIIWKVNKFLTRLGKKYGDCVWYNQFAMEIST